MLPYERLPGDTSSQRDQDEHRVYPGDGIAPLKSILRTMMDSGFAGALSLELFNREYWQQDPQTVPRRDWLR